LIALPACSTGAGPLDQKRQIQTDQKAFFMTRTTLPEEALIYSMVTISAVDASMSDAELRRIGDMVQLLPVFEGYDSNNLTKTSEAASTILAGANGLDDMLNTIADALPVLLHDTAYALAVEVASADMTVKAEEIRFLQMLRDRLNLDKLTIAALERSAIARFRRL
jgi:tellurite resistance protein